ncbi:MAG: hypothetical protein ACXV8J_08425 [Methylobacter sp.]
MKYLPVVVFVDGLEDNVCIGQGKTPPITKRSNRVQACRVMFLEKHYVTMSHAALNEADNATPHEPEDPLRGCLLAVYQLALDYGIAKTQRRLRFGKSQLYDWVQRYHTGMESLHDWPQSSFNI